MEAEKSASVMAETVEFTEPNDDIVTMKEDVATANGDVADIQNDSDFGDEAEEQLKNEAEPSDPRKRKRSPVPEGMTRSAYKKSKRDQKWEAGKLERRAKEKEAKKKKKVEKRAAIASGDLPPPIPKKNENSVKVPVTIVIDCQFDDLMLDGEIKSLASQITRCYSDNNKSKYKVSLAVSGFDKRLKKRFEGPLENQFRGWKGIKFFEEYFVNVSEKAQESMKSMSATDIEGPLFSRLNGQPGPTKGEIIYLSSDSENTIDHLSPYSTYIIGGLVDRNRHKGICYKKACEKGVKTAKFPIGEFMDMSSRKVLATNHVNEIMLRWLEVGDWGEAFMKVIPKRKGGALKGKSGKDGNGEDADGEEAEDQNEPMEGGEDEVISPQAVS